MKRLKLKAFDYFVIFITILSLPLAIIGLWFTDKSVTLPGDTSLVTDIIEVEGASPSAGSFSTIYVISYDHSTKLQNYLVDWLNYGEVSSMPEHYLHLSNFELNEMGRIQYEGAMALSIINAYKLASKDDPSISINYHLDSLKVSFYLEGSSFKIGDEIKAINNINTSDDNFIDAYNSRKIGDEIKLIRNKQELNIKLDKENIKSFYTEAIYKIDSNKPSFSLANPKTGGPSGGFMRALAIYNSLTEYDYTKGLKIAGTGTIDIRGRVGEIGGIKEKVYTAFKDEMDIMLVPRSNYKEALSAYNSLKNKERMQLILVDTLEGAIEVLKNV